MALAAERGDEGVIAETISAIHRSRARCDLDDVHPERRFATRRSSQLILVKRSELIKAAQMMTNVNASDLKTQTDIGWKN
jgi:hypothetical protein